MITGDLLVQPTTFAALSPGTCATCHGSHLVEREVPLRHVTPCRDCAGAHHPPAAPRPTHRAVA